jgi:trypsin-like peptidase
MLRRISQPVLTVLSMSLLAASLVALGQSPAHPASFADSALCPLVYQLDQAPGSHGYRYTFFGNAFFVNEQGYLLTVAHVLDTFRDGGQPYVLVRRPNSPPRLLKITVIATDPAHDVAIVQAKPNPFASSYQVAFLPLSLDPAKEGQPVLALSLHPVRPRNAASFEMPAEDRSQGQVLSYQLTQLNKASAAADVFLLSHPVVKGQSGSPVLAVGPDGSPSTVVGLVEGRWLRGTTVVARALSPDHPSDVPGAAIPIRYAIEVLDRLHIAWHHLSADSRGAEHRD